MYKGPEAGGGLTHSRAERLGRLLWNERREQVKFREVAGGHLMFDLRASGMSWDLNHWAYVFCLPSCFYQMSCGLEWRKAVN